MIAFGKGQCSDNLELAVVGPCARKMFHSPGNNTRSQKHANHTLNHSRLGRISLVGCSC